MLFLWTGMTDKKSSTECGFEEVFSFVSPDEYLSFIKHLEKKIQNNVAVEIPCDLAYSKGQQHGGRWFECVKDRAIWRLLEPDIPFKGGWELVSNYTYPSTRLSLDITEAKDFEKLHWAHMWYALKIKLINHSTIVNKAMWNLQNTQTDETVILLAGLYPTSDNYEIETLTAQLAHIGANVGISKLRDDWIRFACRYWLKNEAEFMQVSRYIDQLYSDLDYPEIMIPFVSYMPVPENEKRDIKTRLEVFC